MTHLSLFSGIGGIDLAAEWAGFRTVAFVERDPFCQRVLKKHWPEVPIYDDVATFDGGTYRGVTLLSGGFPCQPFSVAGRRGGAGDERYLWPAMLRVISEAKPRWVLGENVPGLLAIDGGHTFGEVIGGLADLGYRVGWGMLSAYAAGACHTRKRVFIVACSEGGRTRSGSDEVGKKQHGAVSAMGVDSTNHEIAVNSHSTAVSESVGEPHSGAWAYRPMQNRNWRSWGIEPIVRRGDDGLSSGVVSSNRVRALGNAVVPQQVYPILKAIAEAVAE